MRKHPNRRFRGGLVSKAHRLVYHTTLGSRVIKRKKKLKAGRMAGVMAASPATPSTAPAALSAPLPLLGRSIYSTNLYQAMLYNE